MTCYRDITFCSEKCANFNCHRNYTDEVRAGADAWAKRCGFSSAPVSFENFKHLKGYCAGYRRPVR